MISRRNIANVILAGVSVTVLVTGCKSSERTDGFYSYSKDELVYIIEQMNNEKLELNEEIDDLKTLVKELGGEDNTSVMSSMTNGSSELSFNSFNGRIVIPEGIKYPDSSDVMANYEVSIASNVKLSPNKNWLVQLDNNSIKLEHSSNITGTFEAKGIKDFYTAEYLKDNILKPMFDDRGYSGISYKNIYINGVAVGVQASTQVYIDEDKAQMRVGILGFGEAQVTYSFVYRGEQGATKEENIDSLLSTMKVLGQNVTIN